MLKRTNNGETGIHFIALVASLRDPEQRGGWKFVDSSCDGKKATHLKQKKKVFTDVEPIVQTMIEAFRGLATAQSEQAAIN